MVLDINEILQDSLSPSFKKYNKNIKHLKTEIEHIEKKLEEFDHSIDQENITQEISIKYLLLKNKLERNKRIYKAYHFHRIKKIQEFYLNNIELENLLTETEEHYFKEYKYALKEYTSNFDIDFYTQEPPLEYFIQIYTNDDCGIIIDGDDMIELKKDKIFYVKRKSIIHLLNTDMIKIL
ncbi:hypothetical protein SLOPH_1803 [Spraguea lophii 42_110]|uniref:DNA replication complex GINS protein PSF1 n=1 Tax=Spraguea lophii (strain 42_110) TaxID=1358809 RepID=S7WA29_SPRLO|nr:hypothetical protein SLOPH_1803 [Spraguea lophii 42_110]